MSLTDLSSDGPISKAPGVVEVHVDKASEVDLALNRAIAAVSEAAEVHRMGILVTRVGPGSYVVRARPDVPYGLVRQRHA